MSNGIPRIGLLVAAVLLTSCSDDPAPTAPVVPPAPAPAPMPDEMEPAVIFEMLLDLPDFPPTPFFTLTDDGTLTGLVNGEPCDLTLEEAEFAALQEAIGSLGLDAIEDEDTITAPPGSEPGLPRFGFRLYVGDRTHTRWVEGFQEVEHTDPRVAALNAVYLQLADLSVRCGE